jgi:hypothetical protein
MCELQCVLSEHHHYAHVYNHAHEILTAHRSDARNDLLLRLCADNLCSPSFHQYNLPSADEIAVHTIPGGGTVSTDSRDILLTLRCGPL